MRIITENLGEIIDGISGEIYTKEKLAKEINKRTGILYKLGVTRGNKILILHGGTPSFFADLLSVWNVGACAACVNPDLTKPEVQNIYDFIKPEVVLVSSGDSKNIPKEAKIINLSKDGFNGVIDPGNMPSNIDDDALILFTSGTTGTPKGVVHTFRSLLSRFSLNEEKISENEMQVTLCPLPTYFGHGLIGNSLTPLLSGQSLVLIPGNDLSVLSKLGEIIDKYNITFMSSVPSMWKNAIKVSKPPVAKSLTRIHVGSAPLSSRVWNDIIKWSGINNVVNMYGITETANWVAGASALDHKPEDGLIGRIWGGDISVYTKDGLIKSKGKGEILLKTSSIMTGYYKLPDLNDSVFIDGWFRTGDIGIIDDNKVAKLTGRKKFEINRAGLKIHPEDIDFLLENHPHVKEACAFSIPDPIAGEIVGVAICMEEESETDISKLRSWCFENISKEKVPEKWFLLDEIPKNDRGKVNRFDVSKACI